ncbi:MAG: sulfatase-like hydrolase/transferase [Myxococcota bacterium]
MLVRLLTAVLALAALACGDAQAPAPAPRTPVVWISLDTLRADHLVPYGYERPTSPALARFARHAVRFDAAHSHASATLPSHLSLLTSLLPPQIGITREGPDASQATTRLRLPDTATTLAEVLRDHGYRTAAFTDGGYVHPFYGMGQGFDTFQVTSPQEGAYRNGFRKSLRRAADWLGQTPLAEPPPFLFLHTYDVHEPYSPPAPFDRAFTDVDYPGFREARGFEARPALLSRRRAELSEEDVALARGFYDNGILATDKALGNFLLLLRKRELFDDALIVVFSDHGEEFLDHGDFGHGPSVYQELARVPLLVKLPGQVGGGRVVERPVGLVDLAPTVLALLGLPVPESFVGADLSGVLLGTDDGAFLEERPIYVDVPDVTARVAALRRGSWKLVRRGDVRELYDLASDPREQRDLSAREPERTAAMAEELVRWTAELEASGRAGGSWATPADEPHPAHQQEALRALGYLE